MGHSSAPRRGKDVLNCLLMLGVIIPPTLLCARLQDECPGLSPPPADRPAFELATGWLGSLGTFSADAVSPAAADGRVCELYIDHPLLFLNLVYIVVVDVGFYVIYLVQRSTWLIDPHWQLIPMSIAVYWFAHPQAADDNGQRSLRAALAVTLVFVWGTRLLHNYFRREGWHFGLGEDWRYADMRAKHGVAWIPLQFFAVSVAQHGMLVGLTLPLQAATAADAAPFGVLDVFAVAVCLAGIIVGLFADNQLRRYMLDTDKPMILEVGWWRYSRHPNHFGEQTWWIGLLLLGVAAKPAWWWWLWFGVLFNHPIDTFATLPLIEARMLRRPERVALFKEYQRRTSLLIPLPRRSIPTSERNPVDNLDGGCASEAAALLRLPNSA